MPHINRIRVNNVKYNFGTQYYDDFLMRFSCKNTIYDLANGGGKSVLMLLLLQNMIPNCTLDDKQPIEKLFRTNEGSTTIHSLIEWSLSDAHIRNDYKYMLTGFCARKAKDTTSREIQGEEFTEDGDKNSAAIEYFNYCIFYRKYNDNDIKNLPLEKNGEKITYSGLKNYLKELEKKDLSLEVHIFERKGDYQRFIAEYGIYESEWEIIRGINKTEGHVRTYFETNYKTTRKVVEDLLIEEIIEKSFRNKYAGDGNRDLLAETLLNIKDKLLELSKKKEEINNYDRQISIIDGFMERLNSLKQLYVGIDSTFVKLQRLYNTLTAETQRNKQEKKEAADKRLSLVKDRNEISMKIETAKVLGDMEELEKLSAELEGEEKELSEYETSLTSVQEELKIRECGNYYLEYVEYQREYEKLREIIAHMQEDNAEIISQIRRLTGIKKGQDAIRKNELQREIEKEQDAWNREQDKLKELEEENKKAEKEMAVWEYRLRTCRENVERLEGKMKEIKNNTNLLLAADAPRNIEEKTAEIERVSIRLEELEEEWNTRTEEKLKNRIRLEKIQMKIENLKEELKSIEEQKRIGLSRAEKLQKIQEVYGEQDSDRLMQRVMELYKKTITDCEQQRQLIDRKKIQIENLKQKKPIGETLDVANMIQYINRYHGNAAMSGADYLAGLEYDRKKTALDAIPFLPYSVIITKDFEQIVYDGKLADILQDDGLVPLIDGTAIDNIVDKHSYSSDVIYLMKNKEYYDAQKEETYLKLLEQKQQELTAGYNRKLENEKVILEDYRFLLELSAEDGWNHKENIEDIKNLLTELENEEAALRDEIKKVEKNLSALSQEKQERLERLEMLQKEKENLGMVITCLDEYDAQISIMDKAETECNRLLEQCQSCKTHIEAYRIQTNHRQNRMESMKQELNTINEIWDGNYAKYDDGLQLENPSGQSMDNKLTPEEVNIKLAALTESLNQEHASAADKEKLLGNYKDSMKKCLDRIEYLGGEISYFENLIKENSLVQTDTTQLSELKNQQRHLMNDRNTKKLKMDEKRSVRDKLQGKITHAVSLISKKYGYFDDNLISRQEVKVFLEESEAILSSMEDRTEQINDKLKELEQEGITLQMLTGDTERLMKRSSLKPSAQAGILEPVEDLEQTCQEIAERFDGFIEERFKRSKEFEKDLGMLVDTLNRLNSQALALEIRNNITMPGNVGETEQLIQTFSETNRYIGLEKQRVLQGLEDMQVIKENFENQCIQSCINIRTELERLDKLSVITMGDEQIRIINLKIPYVKEEQYKERMSEYIDRIARATDGFGQTEEKLKYLRNNLCWKRLFSVIVTDMNGIRLNLYKRERIAGQSRYLPYEEAVGSTGQSQGIYIQFLIAIINYISSINSRNADATRLKKVIFIDNPFGAAKDIYIWEPIFKLLKTNNVQLIVPARGATPAITGRFDVNYILGQKMCNGRQQTVVVDYYSNVSGEELEYTTLTYEQTSLFF